MRAPWLLATLTGLVGLAAPGYGAASLPERDATCPAICPRAGQLDATFGSNGMVRISFDADDDGGYYGLDLVGDRIVTAGWGLGGVGGIFFRIALLSDNGKIDASFGDGGQVVTRWAPWTADTAYAVSVGHQRDGAMVAVGWRHFGSQPGDIALARYTPAGALDPGFGDAGKSLIDLGGQEEITRGMVLPDDTILAVGRRDDRLLVVRATAEGALDTSFARPMGYLTFQAGKSTLARGLAVDAKGRILVAGTADMGGRRAMVLLRLTPAGALDPSFGTGGAVIVDQPYVDETAVAVALSPDGRIIVAGDRPYEPAVRRFLDDGSSDLSFGWKGSTRYSHSFAVARPHAEDLVVLPGGGFVVVGNSGGGDSRSDQTLIVRYTCDGNVDSAFGVHGVMRVYLGEAGVLHTARLDTAGRLLLGGADVGEMPGPGTYGVVVRMWM